MFSSTICLRLAESSTVDLLLVALTDLNSSMTEAPSSGVCGALRRYEQDRREDGMAFRTLNSSFHRRLGCLFSK
jgi:hypothetical protein